MAELRIWSFASLPDKQEALSSVIFCQEGESGSDRSSPDRESCWPLGHGLLVSLNGVFLFQEMHCEFQALLFFLFLACRLLAVLYLLQFCCLGKEFKSVCMPQWSSDRLMICSNSKWFFPALQSCFIGATLENEIDVWIHAGSSIVDTLLSRDAAHEYSGESPGTAWQF